MEKMKITVNWQAIYVLWLREMKGMWRTKSRVIGALGMPIFFLAFLGLGFRSASIPEMPTGLNYIDFLTPGIIGMTMLFSSVFAGMSVLWDKEFGFLKEVMVAPVSRLSLVLGRIAGGSTTSLIQGILILVLSTFIGFELIGLSILKIIFTLIFMCLISFTFIGLGLICASRMTDMHGYSLVMNFIVFPIFLLSGALFPIKALPPWIIPISLADPLTYGVDGLRGVLLGVSDFSPLLNFFIISVVCVAMVGIGAFLFEESEVER